MAIAFVNGGTYTTTAGATSLALPPGAQTNNNLLLAFIGVKLTGQTFTVSGAGWTLGGSNNTGNESGAWAWCLSTGSSPSCTFNWGSSAAAAGSVGQYSGNLTVTPTGGNNSANANSATSLTVPGVTTTANNSMVVGYALTSTSQTIAGPPLTGWTTDGTAASANSSAIIIHGFVGISGTTSYSPTFTGTSANWVGFTVEIVGSGASTTGNMRDTGSTMEVLESYSTPATNLRATGVTMEVLESYTTPPPNLRVTGVTMQVLRTVASPPPIVFRRTLAQFGNRSDSRQMHWRD